MPDFSKAKAGDKCFHLKWGEGEIIKFDATGSMVRVQCEDGHAGWVFTDGREYRYDTFPMLYHSRPEISDPPPPKRMVKKTVWQNWYHNSNGGISPVEGLIFSSKECGDSYGTLIKGFIGTFSTIVEYEE